MICKNCGGQIPDGSIACGFCETELAGCNTGNNGEPTDLEKRMAEILLMGTKSEEKPTWWKEDDCAGCGAGLTGSDKDLKYALAIVGLLAGVIIFALAVKYLVAIWL